MIAAERSPIAVPEAAAPAPAPVAVEFQPFVAPETRMRELTVRGLVIGSMLGIVFAASSAYLALKVGLTVSASIPVAVLSITLFKWMAKAFRLQPGTILENNIVQTTGSAGESIAAGVAFTLPSLLLLGFDMELGRILLVALLGGLIGVLMMIPLRQGLIVEEHLSRGDGLRRRADRGRARRHQRPDRFLRFFRGALLRPLQPDLQAVERHGELRG